MMALLKALLMELQMVDCWGQMKEPDWVLHWAASLVQLLVH
jgi:hypothetical protein